jgi:photosystem II stability/assembly factor-like uncharacterized protein
MKNKKAIAMLARLFFLKSLAAFFLFFFSFSILCSSESSAQWKLLLAFPGSDGFQTPYFLDLSGAPRIGFVGAYDTSIVTGNGVSIYAIYKTTDGGNSWKPVILPDSVSGEAMDITFKDSMTGWVGMANLGLYKTTDQGESWNLLPSTHSNNTGDNVYGIYYEKTTGSLFITTYGNTFGGNDLLVSYDDGASWKSANSSYTGIGYSGFAFNNDSVGIVASDDEGYLPWLRTTDFGNTWNPVNMDSIVWQPYAIPGTNIDFAITYYGDVYRSMDAGITWNEVYAFPPIDGSASCVRGDSSRIFVQNEIGCYMSTDRGDSWSYLCGPPSSYTDFENRFYYNDGYVYLPTVDPLTYNSEFWELNLDSMQYFSSQIASQFPNAAKDTTVTPGSMVIVNFLPTTDANIGIDTAHFAIHYDPNSLSLESLNIPAGWSILDSSSSVGTLNLTIISSSAIPLPTPALQLTFGTYLSSTSAKVYLDSANLIGQRLNCDCAALSLAPPDSVQINFTGCGDSLILAALNDSLPFYIKSIQPNPASSSIEINLSPSVLVTYTLFDALGRSVLSNSNGASSFSLDVSNMPSGIYYLRLTQNGYVQSRSISIAR